MKATAYRPIVPRRTVEWSKDRIAGLATPEVTQLRVNAERLNDPDIMGRCDEVLKERKAAARLAAREIRKAAAPKAAPVSKEGAQ